MSDFERFKDTEQVRVPQADMAMAQADQQQAELHGQLSKEGFGFANQMLDNIAAKKGAKDALTAEKQGTQFQPVSNLTQAGRIYNSAAAPIEKSLIASQVQENANEIFQGVMNSPASADPKTGNMAQFGSQIKGYYQGLMTSLPKEYKGYATELYNSAVGTYGSRIAQRVSSYQEAQNKVLLTSKAQSLANLATLEVQEAMANPDPQLREKGIEGAHNNLMQSNSLENQAEGNLSGNPGAAIVANRSNSRAFAQASIMGVMQRMENNYNASTNPSDQLDIAMQMRKFASNPFDNKNIDQKSIGYFNQTDRQILINNLNSQVNRIFKGRTIARGQLKQNMANGLIEANNGTWPLETLKSIAVFNPEQYPQYHSKVEAGFVAHTKLQSISNLPLPQAQAYYSKIAQPGYLIPIEGADLATRQQATSKILTGLRTRFKLAQNDPANWVNQSPRFLHQVQGLIHALPSTGSSRADSQRQSLASNLVADPTSIFKTTLSAPIQSFYHNYLQAMGAEQTGNGINRQNQRSFTEAQGVRAVKYLNGLDGGTRIKALKIAEQNAGAYWPFIQRSLLKAKLPAGDIVAASVSSNPQSATIADDMLAATDASRDPKFYANAGITKDKLYQMVAQNSSMQSVMQGFGSILKGGAGTQMSSSIISTVANLAAWRVQKNGKTVKDAVQSSINDVLQGMWQNSGANGVRIPYTISMTGSNGSTNRYPVDLDTVQQAQIFLKSQLKSKAILGVKTDANPERERMLRASRQAEIESGKWVTNANGDGLHWVDRFGKTVLMKGPDGQAIPYGFSFMGIQHNPPPDFLDFQKTLSMHKFVEPFIHIAGALA